MKNERTLDIIAGIFSIFFIAIVFYLYFLKLFGSGGFYFDLSNDECITYTQLEHQSCYINIIEPTIVLRMDDIRAYSVLTPYLVDELLDRNLSITLGVIPKNLRYDKRIVDYLMEIKNNPNVEIAQHGGEHSEEDINITEESLLKGNEIIQNFLGVQPVTYIPPYNEITSQARGIISKYFRIISARKGILKEGESITEIGQTIETYNYETNKVTPIDEIIERCEDSLEKTNLCIVTIHPQDYATDINDARTLSIKRFEEFKEMLGELEKLDVKFSTFNELVSCYN